MTAAQRFGEELRRQRQARDISLAEISRQTKVSGTLYAALERGDCSRWPSGIYSRSYVRDYAVAVGLDAERVVADFVACFVEVALPDGARPDAVAEASPGTPGGERLRLSLESVPGERWRRLARRGAIALAEVLVLAASAAALALALRIDFWPTLSAAALIWHALGRILPLLSCIDRSTGLTSLPCATLDRARSFTRLRGLSWGSAVWWPRRPQRS